MAEGKKSFVLYSDLILVVKKLIEKDRKNNTNNSGELFYHLLQYVSDENPEPINDTVDLVFEPIKTQLKRDLTKWESRSDRSRENGKLGGRPKKEDNLKEPKETQQVILEPRKPDSVNVSDSDSVKEINNNIEARKLKFSQSLIPFLDLYDKEMIRDFCNYWTEPNKSNTKFKQETEKTWSLANRLERWSRNNFGTNKKNKEENFDQLLELTNSIRNQQ